MNVKATRVRQCLTASRPSLQIPDSVVRRVEDAIRGEALAVMLYGSRARGDFRPNSDYDVLQLVSNGACSYSEGLINVAAYTAAHLGELASQGSLFVRHLRHEGIILADDHGALRRVLHTYKDPDSYEPLKDALRAAVIALRSASEATECSARKVAAYVLRTALYIECAERGVSTFDVVRAASAIDQGDVGRALRSPSAKVDELVKLAGRMLQVTDKTLPDMPRALEPAALWCTAELPMAGRLLEVVIGSKSDIGYTSLTLPIA